LKGAVVIKMYERQFNCPCYVLLSQIVFDDFIDIISVAAIERILFALKEGALPLPRIFEIQEDVYGCSSLTGQIILSVAKHSGIERCWSWVLDKPDSSDTVESCLQAEAVLSWVSKDAQAKILSQAKEKAKAEKDAAKAAARAERERAKAEKSAAREEKQQPARAWDWLVASLDLSGAEKLPRWAEIPPAAKRFWTKHYRAQALSSRELLDYLVAKNIAVRSRAKAWEALIWDDATDSSVNANVFEKWCLVPP